MPKCKSPRHALGKCKCFSTDPAAPVGPMGIQTMMSANAEQFSFPIGSGTNVKAETIFGRVTLYLKQPQDIGDEEPKALIIEVDARVARLLWQQLEHALTNFTFEKMS